MADRFWGVLESVADAPYIGGYTITVNFFDAAGGFAPDSNSNHVMRCSFQVKASAHDGFRTSGEVEAYLKTNLFSGLSGITTGTPNGTASDEWIYTNYVTNIGRLATRFGCRYGIHTMSLFSQVHPKGDPFRLFPTNQIVVTSAGTLNTSSAIAAYSEAGYDSLSLDAISGNWAYAYNPPVLDQRPAARASTSSYTTSFSYLRSPVDEPSPGPSFNTSMAFHGLYNFLGSTDEPLWLRLLLTVNQLAPGYQVTNGGLPQFAHDFYSVAFSPCLTYAGTTYDILGGFNSHGSLAAYETSGKTLVQSLTIPKYYNKQYPGSGGGTGEVTAANADSIGRAQCLAIIRTGQYESPLNTVGVCVSANISMYTDWYFSAASAMNDATSYLLGVAGSSASHSQILQAIQSVGKRASPMAHRAAKLAIIGSTLHDHPTILDDMAGAYDADRFGGVTIVSTPTVASGPARSENINTLVSRINAQQYSWDDAYLK